MKGQRVLLRTLEPSDAASVRGLFEAEGLEPPAIEAGAIAKVVGDLIGVAGWDRSGERPILYILVRTGYRRRGIGRALLGELGPSLSGPIAGGTRMESYLRHAGYHDLLLPPETS
jgi:GNAT superfamily N-acetyltransferase